MLNDLEQRLFEAYFRRFGKDAQQPSQIVDYITEKSVEYAILDNIYGILAIYKLKDENFRLIPPNNMLYAIFSYQKNPSWRVSNSPYAKR